MSAKYSGLPDIDSAPDVFETPDEPAVTQRQDEDNGDENRKGPTPSTGSGIDTSGLPSRRHAGEKFDIRASLVITSAPPTESQVTRLRRLQAEVAQLEADIGRTEKDAGNPVPPAGGPPKRRSVLPARQPFDIVTELSLLREKLSLASSNLVSPSSFPSPSDIGEWPGRLQQLEALNERQSMPAESAAPSSDSARIRPSDVDARLATLEKLVGVSDSPHDVSSISFMDSLNRMDHLLNVLTQPRHLDSIARRVKLLLVDLDRASSASARRGGNAGASSERTSQNGGLCQTDQEALHSLFALLPRLDPLIPVIPPLLTRLRSLSGLHAETLGIAADLREMQSTDRNITEEERELDAIVSNVQQGVTEAAARIVKNWESIQGRISTLEQKLHVLAG